MLSAMYSPRLVLKPTARTPMVIVMIVKAVRDLLPQKSAQIFFQRLLMTQLPFPEEYQDFVGQCSLLDADLRIGAATDSSPATLPATPEAHRIRYKALPQDCVLRHGWMPGVFSHGRIRFRRNTCQARVEVR